MLKSKGGQRVAGLLILLAGIGFTTWSWQTALAEGHFTNWECAFPGFAVFGLGLVLFPFDTEALLAKYGVEKPQKFEHYPLVWKVLIVVAVLVILGNFFLLMTWGLF